MASNSCPDATLLQQFLLGHGSPDVLELLGVHIEQCAICIKRLESLRGTDLLLDAVTVPPPPADTRSAEMIDDLIRRISGLEPAGAKDDYDFLAPARNAGELGWLGPYRVLKVLGVGGMGVVFLAEDPQLKRTVALKTMKPALAASSSARRRFLGEAQAAAGIQDDHVVTILHVGEERGMPFFAMPVLQGERLHERQQREGRLPADEVVRIGREVAAGLVAAHARGMIHRDIKPANIWLETAEGGGGRVKILDFGLARAANADTMTTQSGVVVGTPAYMAPEQVQGISVDARSDLFSLGVLLYHLAAGQLPFPGATPLAILRSLELHQSVPPHTIEPTVPKALSALILELLAKDPNRRPATARAVIDRLDDISARRESLPERWSRRARLAALAGVLFGALIVGLVIAAHWSGAAEAPHVCFEPPVFLTEHIADKHPRCVAVGDFNGDGYIDVAVGFAAGNFEVLLGKGDGRFHPPKVYAADPFPSHLTAVDLNGDGHLDLVYSAENHKIAVWLGAGNGSFRHQSDCVLEDDSRVFVVGDFNGDGKPDLAAISFMGSLQLFLNNGDATFRPALKSYGGANAMTMAAGDFNGDGIADLAIADLTNSNLRVLLGKGDGTFHAPSMVPVSTTPVAVRAADLNGDGRVDLVVSYMKQTHVSVLLGSGDGRFQEPKAFAAGLSADSLLVGDFNGDGKPDLVAGNSDSNVVVLLRGRGDGGLHEPIAFGAGAGPVGLAGGDLHGDGRLDLLTVNGRSRRVASLRNRPAAANFLVTAPADGNAGADLKVVITARKADNQIDTAFTGIVRFSCTDPDADLPESYRFGPGDRGTRAFSVVLKTGRVGTTIAATAAADEHMAGAANVRVWPNEATQLRLEAPAEATAGKPFSATVKALDRFGNIAWNYQGTLRFTCSDGAAILPGNYTLKGPDDSFRTFTDSLTLLAPGRQTLTVVDVNDRKLTADAQVNVRP